MSGLLLTHIHKQEMEGVFNSESTHVITVDSGAMDTVGPMSVGAGFETYETEASRNGKNFRAANGKKIFNEGQKFASMMTKEGAMRDVSFTVCAVTKARGSVSQMCRTGHRVVFNSGIQKDPI